MALLGSSVHSQAARVITSVGNNDQEGWTEVARLSNFPNGSGEYGFVVSGQIGASGFLGLPAGNPPFMEIAIGTPGNVITSETLGRFLLTDTNFWLPGPNGPLFRTRPFFIVRNYRIGTGELGTWNASNPLVLFARIQANGQAVGAINAQFSVGSVSILAFSIDAIGQSKVLTLRKKDLGTSVGQAIASEPYTQHLQSLTAGVFLPGDRWLVFMGVRYSAFSDGGGAPVFQLTHLPTGTSALQEPILGNERLGMFPTSPPQRLNELHLAGGFRTFTATADSQIGVRGRDQHNQSGARTRVSLVDVLAIRTDVFDPFFNVLQKDAGSANDIFNDWGGASNNLVFESAEWSRPVRTPYVVVSQGAWDNRASNESRSFFWRVLDDTRQFTNNQQALPSFTRDRTEGVHQVLGFEQVLPQSVSQLQFHALGNPFEFPNAVLKRPVLDLCAIGFSWDPEVDPGTTGPPPLPPTVVVSVTREAASLASLAPLPVQPDQAFDEELEGVVTEFRSDDGTLITWPRFLSPRAQWTLRWTVDTFNRDVLLSFFDAQDRRAFKWTPDQVELDEVAMVQVGNVRVRDLGDATNFSLEVDALELKYLEP